MRGSENGLEFTCRNLLQRFFNNVDTDSANDGLAAQKTADLELFSRLENSPPIPRSLAAAPEGALLRAPREVQPLPSGPFQMESFGAGSRQPRFSRRNWIRLSEKGSNPFKTCFMNAREPDLRLAGDFYNVSLGYELLRNGVPQLRPESITRGVALAGVPSKSEGF